GVTSGRPRASKGYEYTRKQPRRRGRAQEDQCRGDGADGRDGGLHARSRLPRRQPPHPAAGLGGQRLPLLHGHAPPRRPQGRLGRRPHPRGRTLDRAARADRRRRARRAPVQRRGHAHRRGGVRPRRPVGRGRPAPRGEWGWTVAHGDRHHQRMEQDRGRHADGSPLPQGRPRGGHRARPPGLSIDRAALDRIRRRLLGVGYRITGTWADAEESADEALARLVALEPGAEPDNPEAWLTTVATRLSLDRLRRRQRETYIGAWLPEPVDTALLPADVAERHDDLRVAMLLAYEHLGADERAAFVLREAYALPYAEIAEILHAAAPTVRQWVSRARHRLRTDLRPPEPASGEVIERLVGAVMAGDLDATIAALTDDVRVVSDSGGKVNAARRDIVGA